MHIFTLEKPAVQACHCTAQQAKSTLAAALSAMIFSSNAWLLHFDSFESYQKTEQAASVLSWLIGELQTKGKNMVCYCLLAASSISLSEQQQACWSDRDQGVQASAGAWHARSAFHDASGPTW